MEFYIINAFAKDSFGGNPAGVVLVREFPDGLLMQKVAAELDYSETIFCKQTGEKEFHLKYFTPTSEVEICGHGTIATFLALQDAELISGDGKFSCRTLSGVLEVGIQDGFILMDMPQSTHIKTFTDSNQLDNLYQIMGIEYEESLHPMIISSGLPDIFLPVKNKSKLDQLSPDMRKLANLSKEEKVTGAHAFALGDSDDDYTAYTRNFAPLFGIDEESATGTASGGLAYYLYREGLINNNSQGLFLQGEAMDRPSEILYSISAKNEDIKIQIGGGGVILAKGQLLL